MIRNPRVTLWLWLTVLAAIVLILGWFLVPRVYDYVFVARPKEMRLIGNDWRQISFETDASSSYTTAHALMTNLTGAGTIEGTTRYLGLGALRIPDPPAPLGGAIQVVAENVEITIFDVTGWRHFVDFDNTTGQEVLRLWRDETPNIIDYRPPFGDVPPALLDLVHYQSAAAETLFLETPATTKCCRTLPPYLEIVPNEPTFFGWNLRRGCRIVAERKYEPATKSRNDVAIQEMCSEQRTFFSPADRELDEQSLLTLRVYASLQGQKTALVAPHSFSIKTDGFIGVEDTGNDYLILVHAKDDLLSFKARPLSTEVYMNVHPAFTSQELIFEDSLVAFRPTSLRFSIEGLVGKVTAGLSTIETNELSDISIVHADWPSLLWSPNAATKNDGHMIESPLLLEKASVASLIINGEEQIPSLWQVWSPEIRAAIVGGLIAAFVALVTTLWVARRSNNDARSRDLSASVASHSQSLVMPTQGHYQPAQPSQVQQQPEEPCNID